MRIGADGDTKRKLCNHPFRAYFEEAPHRKNAGSLVLLTRARKNALALRLGCHLGFHHISSTPSALPTKTPHSSSPTYNRLRIQLMSDFTSVGAMLFTSTAPGNAFTCCHKHQAHYRESSSFLRLPDLPEVVAFWETGHGAFRHSIDAMVSLVVSSTTMNRWKRHEQGLANGHKEM